MDKSVLMVVALAVSTQGVALPMSSSDYAMTKMLNSLCDVPASGDHGAVDLNPTALDKDLRIPSHAYDKLEFVIQVCKKLKYTDSICTDGASICEFNKTAKVSTEVYGFSDSITTEWEDEKLVMTMTGGPCNANKLEHTHSKIFFSCAANNSMPITIAQESRFGCFVQLNYPTTHACPVSPTPPPTKYACIDGVCTEASSGADKDTCEAVCGEPTPKPPSYKCSTEGGNPPQCVIDTDHDGEGTSFIECNKTCFRTWKCEGSECTAVLDGSGTSLSECISTCDAPPAKYECKKGKCVEAKKGGTTKDVCESVCEPPVPKKYKCDHGMCVEAEGGVPKPTCESICEGPTTVTTTINPSTLYVCHEGTCEPSATPDHGISYEECKSVCEINVVPAFMTV